MPDFLPKHYLQYYRQVTQFEGNQKAVTEKLSVRRDALQANGLCELWNNFCVAEMQSKFELLLLLFYFFKTKEIYNAHFRLLWQVNTSFNQHVCQETTEVQSLS